MVEFAVSRSPVSWSPRVWTARLTPAAIAALMLLAGVGRATAAPVFPGTLDVPGSPSQMATADFNGDGFADFAVTSMTSTASIPYLTTYDLTVLVGTPDGGFRTASNVRQSAPFGILKVADVDADGVRDLVFADSAQGGNLPWVLSVRRGHGDGTFDPPTAFLQLAAIRSFTFADFDGDGRADLAVAPGSQALIKIYRNDPGGAFVARPDVVTRRPVDSLVAGDLNHDGRADLVATTPTAGEVAILLSTGAGFGPDTPGPGPSAAEVAIGDLNGDGHPDIAALGSFGVVLLFGTGSGAFPFSVSIAANRTLRNPVIGDLDGNGTNEVVGFFNGDFYEGIGTHWLIHMDASGREWIASELPGVLWTYPTQIAIGDFNHDQRADIATLVSQPGRIWLTSGDVQDGLAPPLPRLPVDPYPYGLTAADFDEDGAPDLAATSIESGDVLLWRGDGAGGFGAAEPVAVGGGLGKVKSGDLDHDGHQDIVTVDRQAQDVVVLYGDGHGSFTVTRIASFRGKYPVAFAWADFDLDHRTDLVVTTAYGGEYYVGASWSAEVVLGSGPREFGTPRRLTTGYDLSDVATVDFNHDRLTDIIVLAHVVPNTSGSGPSSLFTWAGIGGGRFGPLSITGQASYDWTHVPYGMAVADFDLDGELDVAIPGAYLRGVGSGRFSSSFASSLTVGNNPMDAVTADFNGDGRPDFLTANAASSDLSLRLGADIDRAGFSYLPFGPDVRVQSGRCPYALAVADFNRDGLPDVAAANACSKDIAILTNLTTDPDRDRDGIPDATDPCTDTDGDGFGDPGFAANTCAPDNCPGTRNDQADGDGDGVGDACDNCTAVSNRDQADDDRDGQGDACDACQDPDRDGPGGASGTTCGDDNCPYRFNPTQTDADADGIGDACDPCTDPDHDGFGDAGYPETTCGRDNCPTVTNPGQEDSDFDFRGDACDLCPFDYLNDADHDGYCADQDTCPLVANPDQADQDGDRVGDRCDNCPAAANHGQEDSNHDGAGDACQPRIGAIHVRPIDTAMLEASIAAFEPQGTPLSGTLEFFAAREVTIPALDINAPSCSTAFPIDGMPGPGIGYLNLLPDYPPWLYDFDWLYFAAFGIVCEDGVEDLHFFYGPCATARYDAGPYVEPDAGPFCLTPLYNSPAGGVTLTVLDVQRGFVRLRLESGGARLVEPFTDGFPEAVDISSLPNDSVVRMVVTITDGETPPVHDETLFEKRQETILAITVPADSDLDGIPDGDDSCTDLDGDGFGDAGFPANSCALDNCPATPNPDQADRDHDGAGDACDNAPPVARMTLPASAECTGFTGAQVLLDASASSDPDSTATTSDIQSYAWFEGSDPATRTALGMGRALTVTFPLGPHDITLVVTDLSGQTSETSGAVTVEDTQAPALQVTTAPAALWPPNHRLIDVRVAWSVTDRCDPGPRVALVEVTSSEPDDAPGGDDGQTTGDIADAALGTADPVVALRAERAGSGPGRIYELRYAAIDASGNPGPALVLVGVPHDQGGQTDPLRLHVETDAATGRAQVVWSAVPGADGYDLITGDVAAMRARNGRVELGEVRVPLRGGSDTRWSEDATEPDPAPGRAFFYLVQYRAASGSSGFGTESSGWPRVPLACVGGCPGVDPVEGARGAAPRR